MLLYFIYYRQIGITYKYYVPILKLFNYSINNYRLGNKIIKHTLIDGPGTCLLAVIIFSENLLQ